MLATILIAYVFHLVINFIAFIVLNFGEVAAILGFTVKRIFSAFSVIITAFIISYLLDPIVTFFQNEADNLNKRKFKTRFMGTVLCYIAILIILSIGAAAVIIKIGYGKGDLTFLESVIESINRMRNDLGEFYASTAIQFNEWGIAEFFTNIVEGIIDKIMGVIIEVPGDVASVFAKTGSTIANFMLSMVIAFYFLKDKERIKTGISKIFKTFVPDKIEFKILNFLREVNAIFMGYLRGQLMDAVIMTTLFITAFSVIGVNFAVIIGLVAGCSSIVPYFGAIIAFILAVSVALISGQPVQALYVAIATVILQQIDATFIIPKVVGQRVKLSPVLVLISITMGGRLFGIMGLIFAVPVCAIIKIFLTRYMERKAQDNCTRTES